MAAMSEQGLRAVGSKLTRSQFLARFGTALLGAGSLVFLPRPAQAHHGSPPPGCVGYGECHCCDDHRCCMWGCGPVTDACSDSSGCWFICYGGNTYVCCDWETGLLSRRCICRGFIKSGCGGGGGGK